MSRSRSFLIRDLLWGQDRRGEAETRDGGDEVGLDLTTRPLGCSRATQCSDSPAAPTEQSLFSSDIAASSPSEAPSVRRTTPLLHFTAADDDPANLGGHGGAKRRAGQCVCGKEALGSCVCMSVTSVPQGLESSPRWVPQVPSVGTGQDPDLHEGPRRSPGASGCHSLSDDAGGGDIGGSGGCDLSWRSRASPTPTPSPSTPPQQSPPISPSVPRRRTPSPPTSSHLPALLPGFPPPAYSGSRGFLRPEKVLDVRRLLPLPGGRGQYGGVPLVAPQHHHHHYLWAARYSSLLSSLPLQGEHTPARGDTGRRGSTATKGLGRGKTRVRTQHSTVRGRRGIQSGKGRTGTENGMRRRKLESSVGHMKILAKI